jgi:hypothetical protein
MRVGRNAVGVLVVLLCSARFAWAHRPYEHVERVIVTPAGKLTLVAHYEDGIIGSDPVKLIVRDAQGKVLAETKFATDVALSCPTSSRCIVFLFDSPILLPTEILRLSGTGFTNVDEWSWLTILGVAAHVWRHWLGYLVSVALIFVPIVIIRRTDRLRQGALRTSGFLVSVPFGLLVYAVWLWGVLTSDLSITITVAMAAVVGFADSRVTLRGRRTRG